MNLTRLALNNTRITLLLLGMIILMGITGYSDLSRNAMPPFTIRVCSIVTSFPGASPERVEELITDKIEKVVQEIPELKTVTSESRTGLSIVSAELIPSIPKKDLQPVWDKIRRKVENLQGQLPQEAGKPNVKDDGVGVVYGIMLGLAGDGYSMRELKQVAEEIKDDLVKLEDASEVAISGIQQERVYVEFDNARLAEVGLASGQLKNIISTTNIVFSGGEVGLEGEKIVLEPTGNYKSVEDIKNTIIPVGQDNQTLRLGDIANVVRTYKRPSENLVRINGQPGLTISTALREGANLTRLGEIIDEKVAAYQTTLPIGLELRRIASQDYYVNAKVQGFISNVLQSVGIVIVVMLLFLGFRTGMVVASLIPLAMIMTLLLMDMFGVGLNQVTLAALIMALGLLVDNAIVISESMMVKMEDGMDAKQAGIESSKELIIPLLISSLTTSAAFLAFFLAENTMGEMMGPLFVVITMALLSSWLMAMTIVVMLGITFIKVKTKKESTGEEKEKPAKASIFDRLSIYYAVGLRWSLKSPLIFLALIMVMFVGSLMLFPTIPFIFFPDSDRNMVTMNVNFPLGTEIDKTTKAVKSIENFIEQNLLVGQDSTVGGITGFASFVGQGPKSYDLGYQPGEANSGYAHLLFNTTSFEANNKVVEQLDNFTFNAFPDAEVSVGPLAGGGGGGSDVEVRIIGESPAELFRIADEIKQGMSNIEGTKNIQDSWGPKIKKLVIDINQDKANRAGVNNQDIAISLQTALDGFNAGSFRSEDEAIPIMMGDERGSEMDVSQLNGLNVFSQNSGRNVPLIQVADIVPDWQYAKILRRNIERTLSVSCDAKDGYTPTEVTAALTTFLEESSKEWKPGYTYTLGGESEQSAEAMGAVASKLPLAFFIILLLLVIQFGSFRKTFIVLLSIPLGIIGVILGLIIFQSSFGFMAFLGVISLAGIVINNAIVLIDRINIEQEEYNRTPFQAITEAAKQRFRPILLTTFTTTLGLIPLYLGGGAMWKPMAVAIMVGLLFATVITLLFVPVLYKLLFRIKEGEG